MASTVQTEYVFSGSEAAGLAVVAACCALSLVSIMAVFVILGVSAVRTRHSPDNTLFVRGHVAKYFVSLLMCNIIQSIGGLMSIPWIIKNRVYSSVTCTAQAVVKEIGNSGTGIFCIVVAAHTFSLLFLRRQWSDRTSYIILIVSWAFIFLELGFECLILAKPKVKGPYFGVAGYWCWITPSYPLERYTTSYLIIFLSAGISFILYLLVFFRLRGNISVSAGCKVDFHRRPKVRFGRMSNGTYIVTDDHRVESHLTRVAKHMLWYPIVYTVLVLPQAAARLSGFSGASVPFPVTVATTGFFLLHGFVNTVLFCTTRNVLPGSWRQKFGLSTMGESGKGDVGLSSRSNAMWRFRTNASTGTAPVVLSVGVEKDVEIKYEAVQPSPSSLKFGSLSPPTSPTRAHTGGGNRYGNHKYLIRDTTAGIFKVDGNDDDSYLTAGVDPTSEAETRELEVPPHSLTRSSGWHERGWHQV